MVAAANRPDPAGPNRTSLPSMFPPDWVAVIFWFAPTAVSFGLPLLSKCMATSDMTSHSTTIAVSSATPCFTSPTIFPNVQVNPKGIASSIHISRMFVIGLGFSYGCGGVGVERTAAVLADLLDRFLARDRTAGDRLGLTRDGRDRAIGVEVLDGALAHEHEGEHDRQREEEPEGGAREVDPEVADGARPAARDAADERDHDRGAGRGRHEVVHREPGHLRELAHRRLADVVLPVRVGEEAHRGVQRERGADVAEVVGIQRRDALAGEVVRRARRRWRS